MLAIVCLAPILKFPNFANSSLIAFSVRLVIRSAFWDSWF